MIKTDIIKTYIFEPNYHEYEKEYDNYEIFKIFNNINYRLEYIIYNICYWKNKQIKQNYAVSLYFSCDKNKIHFTKLKNYDNTKIDINTFYSYSIYNCDLKITNNEITKKIDKYIYITKYINNKTKAIRKHTFFNSKYCYSKRYISYYINYYIIIFFNIQFINIINKAHKAHKYNIIFCNFSRNFMLFI